MFGPGEGVNAGLAADAPAVLMWGSLRRMGRTRLKVCCISSVEEARLAVAVGADALGLVGQMPTGPGVIGDELAREIARSVPLPVVAILLTARLTAHDIIDHARFVGVSTVQIVRHVEPSVHERMAELAPWLHRLQVLHVEDESVTALATAYEPHVDAVLLDSGRPLLSELGGTGRVHDWQLSAKIVAASNRPVFLAGGLTHMNVGLAIKSVLPFALDVCSGVRSGGQLDRDRLDAFVAAARSADLALAR
jgi:phosphoribosylanthranilate isomerase